MLGGGGGVQGFREGVGCLFFTKASGSGFKV